jgi:phage FluMu gp28-like protein
MPRSLRALVLMHNTSFSLQRTVLCDAMSTGSRNVGCGDATGLGMDSNETLATKFPGRWTPFTFSASGKREIGSLLKTAFDDQDQRIPSTDGEHKFIATDLYAVQKEGDAQTLKLVESGNPMLPESHCDVAYSGGLARKAAQTEYAMPRVSVG